MRSDRLERRLSTLPRALKSLIVVAVDGLLGCLAVVLAIYFRVDTLPPPSLGLFVTMGWAVATALPIFMTLGLYRTILRHADWATMTRVAQAVLLASVPMIGVVTVMGVPGIPRTVGLLQPILFLILVAASRAGARIVLGQATSARGGGVDATRVVIYGAGSAGRQLCSALANDRQIKVVGFVDDDVTLQGRTMNTVPIFGPDQIEPMAAEGRITEVLLALPSASRKRRNEIIGDLRRIPLHVQTLPALGDLARGKVQLSDLRELDVEDLLGRQPVTPNAILLGKNIMGKTVLVTGAGGSIGSELCRQILALRPATLLLVEASEYALYQIHGELDLRLEEDDPPALIPLLASVRDGRRIEEIITAWRPDTIYHAAAYKHVPLVEHNIVEGIRNNVWGTLRTAAIARRRGVADFVLISTDKAVRPTNVMGTSKRLAEMVLQAFAEEGGGTRFSMVRFGNVLGSSGSVVPLFRRQIEAGGPVTITHRDITRYFMTIPEAAQLVIQAGAMASGGEVFVLDMGEPVRIEDLARNMIELSGFTVRDADHPEGDIEISVIGLRPGEKLYEELLIGDNPEPTRHPRIMKANEQRVAWPRLRGQLDLLSEMLDGGDARGAREFLREIVPEYHPDSDMVDWTERGRESA